MNWFKQLFGIGDKMQTDIHGLPYVQDIVSMPKVKPPKGKDISEPVLGIIRAFKENPKRFKFKDDGHPRPNYFSYDRYTETTGNYFCVLDTITGEKFFCSVSGLTCLRIQDSKTFISRFGNLCALGISLKKAKNLMGSVHNEWVTKDESELLVEVIGNHQRQRIIKATEWYEYKDAKEERTAKIQKALKLAKERQRLCEVYK